MTLDAQIATIERGWFRALLAGSVRLRPYLDLADATARGGRSAASSNVGDGAHGAGRFDPLPALLAASHDLPCREIRVDGRRYLERHFVAEHKGLTFYLHRFLAPDPANRELHNHPWALSASLILAGGYAEERLDDLAGWNPKLRRLEAGDINVIRRNDFHRIAWIQGETWTLFAHGAGRCRWGFLGPMGADGDALFRPYRGSDAAELDGAWWHHAPTGAAVRARYGEPA